jgi:hypothetical protein
MIYGLKKSRVYSVKGIEADPDGNEIEIRFKIPTVITIAKYSANGRISFLNIRTKGNVNLTFGKYLCISLLSCLSYDSILIRGMQLKLYFR